mgnify:CR=1 FL=1
MQDSEELLDATLDMDEEATAEKIEKFIPNTCLQYSITMKFAELRLSISLLSAMQYYLSQLGNAQLDVVSLTLYLFPKRI